MRILFMGAGAFGQPTLEALHAQHDVVAVVSQQDKPAGRKRILTPTPISQWALDNDVTLLRYQDVNAPEALQELDELAVDACVVIAYGQKLSKELLSVTGRLSINLHGSLLPAWRGAAPVQRALMAGDKQAGVSVIGLASRMDAGEVYARATLDIGAQETAGELHDRLAELGPEVVLAVLHQLEQGSLNPQAQDETKATHARKLSKAEATVDFDQLASAVRAQINGLTPWPGCAVQWEAQGGTVRPLFLRRVCEVDGVGLPGQLIADGVVACASGAVRLLEVQEPGGKLLSYDAFRAGRGGPSAGDKLTPK